MYSINLKEKWYHQILAKLQNKADNSLKYNNFVGLIICQLNFIINLHSLQLQQKFKQHILY